MNLVQVEALIRAAEREVARLTTQLATAQPGVQITDAAGKVIDRVAYLQRELSGAQTTLNNLKTTKQALQAAQAARAAGQAVKQPPSLWSRIAPRLAQGARSTGRGIINVGRWVLRKPPLPPAALGGAATIVGTIAAVALAAGLVYGGARIAGYLASDPSVRAGSRMNQPSAPPVVVDNSGAQKFAVFVLPNSGSTKPDWPQGTIWIGDEDHLKTLRACDTPNGGRCEEGKEYPPVSYTRLNNSPNFSTEDEALVFFCGLYTPTRSPFGTIAVPKGDGNRYWAEYSCP